MSTTFAVLMLCAPLAQEPAPAAQAAQSPSPVEAPAVAAINGFGLDLYKVLAAREPRENLFFSPLSVTMALTMVAEGARDETRAEMVKVLHLPEPLLPAHEGFAALGKRLVAQCGTLDSQQRRLLDDQVREYLQLQEQIFRNEQSTAEDRRRLEVLEAAIAKAREGAAAHDLTIANALWIDRGANLLQEFVESIERHYGSRVVSRCDFAAGADRVCRQINAWVEEQTRGRIRELSPLGPLDERATLLLTNAVYFQGLWQTPFRRDATHRDGFTLENGTRVRSLFMHRSAKDARYAAFDGRGARFETPVVVEDPPPEGRGAASGHQGKAALTYPDKDGFLMVELPYLRCGLGMLVIVPQSSDGLGALERRLDAKAVSGWVEVLEKREVDLTMPRFHAESVVDLTGALDSLGMKRAFSQEAQFGGMARNMIRCGAVSHRSSVSVDEEGTLAVDVTFLEMMGISNPRPFIPVFRADRPFLFLIRDTTSGAILFVGRVVRPIS